MIKRTTKIFFLVFLIIQFINSDITFESTNQIITITGEFNQQLTVHMQSYSFQGNHFVGIRKDENDVWSITFVSGSELEYSNNQMSGIAAGQQIRSGKFNVELSTSTFIIFNEDEVRLVKDGGGLIEIIYNEAVNSKTVIDACFGYSQEYVFVLVKDQINQIHEVITIINQIQQNSFNLNVPLFYLHDQFLFHNGSVFVVFQGNIMECIFQNASKTFVAYKITSIDFAQLFQMHMIITEPSNFSYVINDKLTITDFDDVDPYIWQKQFDDQKISAIAMANFKLVLLTQHQIIMFDLEVQEQISRIAHGRNGSKNTIGYHSQANRIIVYSQFPEIAQSYQVYDISASYSCSNCVNNLDCFATYVLNKNKTKCIKQIEYNPQLDHINQQQQQLRFGMDPSTIRAASQQIGKGMSVASLKIMPNFILAFTIFLDDLWFYRFHRYNYPKQVGFVMQQVDVVNQLRLGSGFFNFLNFFGPTGISNDKNKQFYEYLEFEGTDPCQVYFLYSAEETYKSNLFVNLIFFGVIRLLLFGLKNVHNCLVRKEQNEQIRQSALMKKQQIANISCKSMKKSSKRVKIFEKSEQFEQESSQAPLKKRFKSVIKKMKLILKEGSHWWSLLVAILETNMLKLTFNCFVQFLLPSSFSFSDKINLTISVLCLFSLLFYCCCFYFYIFTFQRQKYSEVLLTKTKYKLRSFLFETIFVVSRNFVRGIIHAFFIRDYKVQISFLSASDLVFVVFAIKMWNCFQKKAIAVLTILYSICLLTFDFFFCLKVILPVEMSNWDDEQVSTILVLILFFFSISICTFFLSALIHETVKKLCRSNKNKINLKQLKQKSAIKQKSFFHISRISTDIDIMNRDTFQKKGGLTNLKSWNSKKGVKMQKFKSTLKVISYDHEGLTDINEMRTGKRHIKFEENTKF